MDVSMYVTLRSQGCPGMYWDVLGTLKTWDVSMYLTLSSQGCPGMS